MKINKCECHALAFGTFSTQADKMQSLHTCDSLQKLWGRM